MTRCESYVLYCSGCIFDSTQFSIFGGEMHGIPQAPNRITDTHIARDHMHTHTCTEHTCRKCDGVVRFVHFTVCQSALSFQWHKTNCKHFRYPFCCQSVTAFGGEIAVISQAQPRICFLVCSKHWNALDVREHIVSTCVRVPGCVCDMHSRQARAMHAKG